MLLEKANVNVIIASWHSPIAVTSFAKRDTRTADNVDLLFRYAYQKYYVNNGDDNHNGHKQKKQKKIKIAIHLEPYDGRTAESTLADIKYLYDKYNDSPVLYRSPAHDFKPFFYVYDSYKMSDSEWQKFFRELRSADNQMNRNSNSKMDGIFLGLYLDQQRSQRHLLNAGFDGFYTYGWQ